MVFLTGHADGMEDGDEIAIPPEILQDLESQLYAEARAASASRLFVGELCLGRISILLDLHISEAGRLAPIALDTHA